MCVATGAKFARSLVWLKEYQVRRVMARSAEHHPHVHEEAVAGVGCFAVCSNTNLLRLFFNHGWLDLLENH